MPRQHIGYRGRAFRDFILKTLAENNPMRKAYPRIVLVAFASLTFGLAGCNKNNTQDASAQSPAAAPADQSPDPATTANLAPAAEPAPSYSPGYNNPQNQNYSNQDQNYSNEDYDAAYEDTNGQPLIEAPEPPPPLPEYSQPEIPGDGYVWTPGYWSYGSDGYYWVPGAWALPPEADLLWTPGYWDSSGGRYRYHNGYWGRHVGYYGGINYGYGYEGAGYQGGYWSGNRFNYNRAANNVHNANVHEYDRAVSDRVTINNQTINITNSHASYNGPGGVNRRPQRRKSPQRANSAFLR